MEFDRIIDRRGTDSVKWESYGDALPLWVADMDFPAPPPVLRALRERVEHGVLGYSMPPADLRPVLQARLKERYGWEVEAEAISFVPGVMRGVHMAGRAVGGPGDGILIQPPVYYPFFEVPECAQRETQLAEVRAVVDGGYEIDFDAFEAAISSRTRLYLLCNPHNPIGRAFTRCELERLAEICLRHGLVICSDEIHCDLIFEGCEHVPIASLGPEVAARTVTLFAPSKTFNVAGLACSVMVIQDPELRDQVEAAGAGLVHGCNVMGYTAALAAYRDCDAWLTALLRYLEANRALLVDFCRERMPDVQVYPPEATFLAWLDCRAAGLPQNPHRFFLEQAGVALNDGARFGPGGEGFVRLNFGCPRAVLVEALERMALALGEVDQ